MNRKDIHIADHTMVDAVAQAEKAKGIFKALPEIENADLEGEINEIETCLEEIGNGELPYIRSQIELRDDLIRELDHEICEKDSTMEERDERIGDLEAKAEATTKAQEEAATALKEAKVEIEELREEVERLQDIEQDNRSMLLDVRRLKERKRSLDEDIVSHMETIQGLRSRNQELIVEIRNLQA